MKVSLVHNPTAGDGQDVDQVVALLRDAGHRVRHRSSTDDWRSLLQDPDDLLVAAGGDGTVREVALAAAEHALPFAILPLGTANNLAKSLGMLGDARDLVASWNGGTPIERWLDLGEVSGRFGVRRFLEGAGGGLVATLIERGEEAEEGSLLLGRETDRAVHLLAEIVRDARPRRWRVVADGHDLSGEYLAVEALNVRFIGPNVPVAPVADPSDWLLDLVLVAEADRGALLDYLEQRMRLAGGPMPELRITRVRRVVLTMPAGERLRVDDRLDPKDGRVVDDADVELRVLTRAVRVLGRGEDA